MRNFIVLSLFIGLAASHSWLACADYASEGDTQWDHTKCRGYGRSAKDACQAAGTNDLASFGRECNMANNGQAGCPKPRTTPISAAYSAQYPMATYYQGQRVCLAWPAKNHAAATCTNQYIPDNGIKLLVSDVNPTADPPQASFDAKALPNFGNGVHQTATIDFKGFQNCSRFCENMGNAFCSGCFNVPADMAVGTYTFQWAWFFNSPGDSYRTCYDVEVRASADAPPGINADGSSIDGSAGAKSGGLSSGGAAAIAIVIIVVAIAAVVGGILFLKFKRPGVYDDLTYRAKALVGRS